MYSVGFYQLLIFILAAPEYQANRAYQQATAATPVYVSGSIDPLIWKEKHP
jgi:hypothetical protein